MPCTTAICGLPFCYCKLVCKLRCETSRCEHAIVFYLKLFQMHCVMCCVGPWQGREALDMVSGRVISAASPCSGTIVYSWGSGTNYQLGTGAVSRHEAPARVDGFSSAKVVRLSAAKFHSAALCGDGCLYTWGHGRGGRLGTW